MFTIKSKDGLFAEQQVYSVVECIEKNFPNCIVVLTRPGYAKIDNVDIESLRPLIRKWNQACGGTKDFPLVVKEI